MRIFLLKKPRVAMTFKLYFLKVLKSRELQKNLWYWKNQRLIVLILINGGDLTSLPPPSKFEEHVICAEQYRETSENCPKIYSFGTVKPQLKNGTLKKGTSGTSEKSSYQISTTYLAGFKSDIEVGWTRKVVKTKPKATENHFFDDMGLAT